MSQASTATDLQNLIRTVEQLHPSQRLNLIRLDFQQRRRRDSSVRVETYLEAFPAIGDQDALDLIYHEIVLREELKEKPTLDEYSQRFPSWRDALSRQFMLHEALADESLLSDPSLAPPTIDHVANADSLPADQLPTLVGANTRTRPDKPLPTIPGYRIDSVLGKGAMGVVYKAWQEKPPRFVALKMILGQADETERRRFLSETEAVARLQHSNIVQIFHVSEEAGLPFFSMELVEGGTLGRKLGGAPWSANDAAEMIRTLAQAMHHAHQRSIIHRDLKPGNVLLTADGAPKISDFGLAKQVDAPQSHTISGAIVGTPSYMAPEQARAVKDLGPPADIYALGAILYEMLTGRPPFRGETLWDTVSQVITEEPVSPRRLQSKVPIDLETIALKCLHKDPKRRYASADALAKDLRRFLDGMPIEARPVSTWERLVMWSRRRPMVASLLGLLAVVIVVGFSLVTYFWRDAVGQAERIVKQQKRDAAKTYQANIERADRDLFVNKDLQHARKQLELCDQDQRGWEWRYLFRLSNFPSTTLAAPAQPWTHIVPRGDASIFALASANGAVMTWDLDKDRQLDAIDLAAPVTTIEWTPAGKLMVGTRGTDFVQWSGADKKDVLVRNEKRLAVSPAKQQWAVAHKNVVTLGPGGRTLSATHKLPIVCLAFDAEGMRLVSGSGAEQQQVGIGVVPGSDDAPKGPAKQGEVIVWDLQSGEGRLLGHHGDAVQLATFSANGALLATAGRDLSIMLWDVVKGKKIAETRRLESVTHLRFSPGGRYLTSVDKEGMLHLWDLDEPTRQRLALSVRLSSPPVYAWNRDDTLFALAGSDSLRSGEVQVWRMGSTPQPYRHYLGHLGAITALAFDAKKPRLLSAGADMTVQVWDLEHDPQARTLDRDITAACWSADGNWIAWGNDEGKLTLWNARTGAAAWSRDAHVGTMLAVAFLSGGTHLVSAASDFGRPGEVKVWSCADGKELATLPKQAGVGLLAPHPERPLLAVPGDKHRIMLWDPLTPRIVGELPGHDQILTALRFAPDGTLLSTSADGTLKVWDVDQQTLKWTKSLDPLGIVAALPWKGDIAWVGQSKPRHVRFVDAPDTSLIEEDSQTAITTLDISADGARFLLGTVQGEVAIWDPTQGHRLLGLRPSVRAAVRLLAADPQGRGLLSLGKDGNLLLRTD